MLIGSFLALGSVVIGCVFVLMMISRHPPMTGALIAVTVVAWLVLSALQILAVRTISAIEAYPDPRPVYMALAQPRRVFQMRCAVALLWLVNTAIVIFLGQALIGFLHIIKPSVGTVFQVITEYVVTFASAYASNTFLLLAIGSLYPKEQFLRRVWSLRLLLDALVAFAVPLAVQVFDLRTFFMTTFY